MAADDGGTADRNGHAAATPRPGLPPALAAALRDALAGAGSEDEEGEDGLEPFPTDAVGAAAPMLPAIAAAPPKAVPQLDEAIRRFHREIGLLPPEDEPAESAAAVAVLPAPPEAPADLAPAALPDAPATEPLPALPPELPPAAEAVPAEPAALVPPAAIDTYPAEVVPAAAGAGSGDGAGGGSGGGAGAPPPGGDDHRRTPFWLVEDRPMTIFEHLDELRARLVRSAIAFLVAVAICFPVTGRVLKYTIANAQTFTLNHGAQHISIIGGAPLAAVFQFMEMDMILALVLAGPVMLYQAVAFVMPALTRSERRALFAYLPASMVLLAAGLAFGLFVFQPVVMRVATTFITWVQPVYTIQEWVGFVVKYSMYFALLYQLPVVVGLAVRMGLVTPSALAKGRRWAFMGCLILALMFAPPADFIVTPSLIVGPLYGLYELSILVARVVYRQRLRAEDAE